MEPSENGQGDHLPGCSAERVDAISARDPLAHPLVRPRLVEGLERVLMEHPTKVGLVQNDHVIEAFSPDTAKKPLADRIQIRRPRRDTDDFDAGSLGVSSRQTSSPEA